MYITVVMVRPERADQIPRACTLRWSARLLAGAREGAKQWKWSPRDGDWTAVPYRRYQQALDRWLQALISGQDYFWAAGDAAHPSEIYTEIYSPSESFRAAPPMQAAHS